MIDVMSPNQEQDAWLGRLEWRAAALTVVFAIVAALLPQGGMRAAGAVVGGALLAGASYWTMKRSVTNVVGRATRGEPIRRRWLRGTVLIVGRYALLAGTAYVMIARLRLPLIGLLGGASVITAAAAFEIVRRRQ